MGKIGFAGGKVGMAVPVPPVTGIALGSIAEGSLVKINENGSPVEFYVAKHNYESGLNSAGRTLLVRKACYNSNAWNSASNGYLNTYATSYVDAWLNGDYKGLLDATVRDAVGLTTFYYTPGNLNAVVTTLVRSVFLMSLTELGLSDTQGNTEGSALPIASTLRTVYLTEQWTRSPRNTTRSVTETSAFYMMGDGATVYYKNTSQSLGVRPCFTFPATAVFDEETLEFKGVA